MAARPRFPARPGHRAGRPRISQSSPEVPEAIGDALGKLQKGLDGFYRFVIISLFKKSIAFIHSLIWEDCFHCTFKKKFVSPSASLEHLPLTNPSTRVTSVVSPEVTSRELNIRWIPSSSTRWKRAMKRIRRKASNHRCGRWRNRKELSRRRKSHPKALRILPLV